MRKTIKLLELDCANCAAKMEESIKKIDGVMGTSIVGDQYQVIVGPKAIHLCKAIQDAYGIAGAGKKQEKAKGNIVNRFLETVSGCIAPLVPALAASGLIKVLLTICSMLNLNDFETIILVVFCSLPTASAAYILTRYFNGDSQLMAGVISLQTLCFAFTFPVLMILLN